MISTNTNGVREREALNAERFKDTALTIHRVVTQRLYRKEGYTSLQLYFQDKWNMSRAQVYRFCDAAIVYQVCPV